MCRAAFLRGKKVIGVLRACKYCGKIHDSKYDCGKKPKKKKRRSIQNDFRNTKDWRRKAKEIKQRDVYLCALCAAKGRITPGEEVHHIEPLEECYDRRLDNTNLITLCRKCHEECEAGEIDRRYQHLLAERFEKSAPP